MRGINRRRVELGVVVSAMLGMSACATVMKGNASSRNTYPLVVTNRSDFEVVVYAIPSAGATGIRLGNARSFATTNLTIPRNVLSGSDVLVVRLHAIGSSNSQNWTSPAMTIDSTVTAQLDIRADGAGNLSRSMLYTEVGSLSRSTRFGHR